MRAYYYDNTAVDQRLAHDSGFPVELDRLRKLGLTLLTVPLDTESGWEPVIDKMATEHGWDNRDIMDVTKEGLGDRFEEMLDKYFTECVRRLPIIYYNHHRGLNDFIAYLTGTCTTTRKSDIFFLAPVTGTYEVCKASASCNSSSAHSCPGPRTRIQSISQTDGSAFRSYPGFHYRSRWHLPPLYVGRI
jgi:hypothetical protein